MPIDFSISKVQHSPYHMHIYGSFAIDGKNLSEALYQACIGIEDVSLLSEMRGGQCQIY